MIYSNVRELVEHQQYVFDTLWNKSIPSQEKLKKIDNHTQYMDGRQALVATTSDQYNKQIMIVTSARVHLPDTQCDPNTLFCQPFQFLLMYNTNVDNFPTYLNQFQTMVSKFHVNG